MDLLPRYERGKWRDDVTSESLQLFDYGYVFSEIRGIEEMMWPTTMGNPNTNFNGHQNTSMKVKQYQLRIFHLSHSLTFDYVCVPFSERQGSEEMMCLATVNTCYAYVPFSEGRKWRDYVASNYKYLLNFICNYNSKDRIKARNNPNIFISMDMKTEHESKTMSTNMVSAN